MASAAQTTLHAVVHAWAKRHLATTPGWPHQWEHCLHEGWYLSPESEQRVTLYQAWCLHFREAIKHNAEAFRIFVASQLADLLPGTVAAKVDNRALGNWLAERVAPLVDAIERVEATVSRMEGKLDKVLSLGSSLPARGQPFDELPAPSAHFVGRDAALHEIAELLCKVPAGSPVASAVITAGLQGMGGIGKTALAFAVGHALKPQYSGGQVFFALGAHSGQPQTGLMARRRWLQRQLPPGTPLPEDEQSVSGLYRARLAEAPGPVLVVIDDPGTGDDLHALQPRAGDGLLVTSRKRLPGLRALTLPELPRAAAHALLSSTSGRELTDTDAHALAERCAFLPIALKAAASFLARRPSKPVSEYLAELQRDRLVQLSRLGADDGSLDVHTVLAFSLRDLLECERQALLALCVVPGDFNREFGAAVAGGEGELLDALVEAGLLEYDAEADRFGLHDLLRETTRRIHASSADAVLEEAGLRYARAVIAFAERCEEAYLSGGDRMLWGLAAFDRERRNIDHAFDWLAMRVMAHAVELESLANAIAHVAGVRLSTLENIRWQLAALDAARRIGDRRSEGNHLNNLGVSYADRGEVARAIEHLEAALLISRETGDRHSEGNRMGNLANRYMQIGDATKAIELSEAALRIRRDIGDRRGEGGDLGNLGLAYAELGELANALKFHGAALKIMRETGDRFGEGRERGNMGNVCARLGDVTKAIEHHEAALKTSREVGDRRSEGRHLGNLGLDHSNLGNAVKAIEHLEAALKVSRDIGDLRGEAYRLGNLGSVYADVGDVQKAIERLTACLVILEAIHDPRAGQVRAQLERLRNQSPQRPA
jgi:tetratricopeptide (TPR) repeat protein